jgi:membrane protease subunit (stomatin/prohibitin family)
MGLTPTVVNARSSSVRRRIFSCDSLSDSVLLAPGFPPIAGGRENVIADGSVIAVSEGQCAILVSRGRVFDLCAEPGAYAYSSGTLPEPLSGALGAEALKNLYPYPPDAGGYRLYYVKIGPVSLLSFSSGQGIPFRIVLPAAGLDLDVMLCCEGSFRYRICDPALFFADVAGPVEDCFRSRELNELLTREAETALLPVLARISADETSFPSKQAFCQAVAAGVTEQLADIWREKRGIQITELTIGSIRTDSAASRYFDSWLTAGMQTAAQAPEVPALTAWYCPACGAASTGNFCPQGGRRKP